MRWRLSSAALLVALPAHLHALITPLTRVDIERALALARWRYTDTDRARFHQRYIVNLYEPPVDSWLVARIEVITEFRRVELMAEQHTNDLWGRGGLRDVEEALQPYRGHVSLIAHLELRSRHFYIGPVPRAELVFAPRIKVIDVQRRDIAANCGKATCPVVGGQIEAIVNAASVRQSRQPISVMWKGKELGRVSIDFGALE